MLEAVQVTRVFRGLIALSNVDLCLGEREIVGLIGPNGAGKTTLFNVMTGFDRPTKGTVNLDGRMIEGLNPYQIAQLGIGRTFQKSMLFERMTVRENAVVGRLFRLPRDIRRGSPFSDLLLGESVDDNERIQGLLDMVGLLAKGNDLAGALPYGEQRLLEIARVLALGAPFILLDEPAAGMNSEETQRIVEIIRKIRDTMGRSVLVIEHDMQVIMNVCDRVVVLDHGIKIADGTPQQVQRDERVIEAYLGRRRAKNA